MTNRGPADERVANWLAQDSMDYEYNADEDGASHQEFSAMIDEGPAGLDQTCRQKSEAPVIPIRSYYDLSNQHLIALAVLRNRPAIYRRQRAIEDLMVDEDGSAVPEPIDDLVHLYLTMTRAQLQAVASRRGLPKYTQRKSQMVERLAMADARMTIKRWHKWYRMDDPASDSEDADIHDVATPRAPTMRPLRFITTYFRLNAINEAPKSDLPESVSYNEDTKGYEEYPSTEQDEIQRSEIARQRWQNPPRAQIPYLGPYSYSSRDPNHILAQIEQCPPPAPSTAGARSSDCQPIGEQTSLNSNSNTQRRTPSIALRGRDYILQDIFARYRSNQSHTAKRQSSEHQCQSAQSPLGLPGFMFHAGAQAENTAPNQAEPHTERGPSAYQQRVEKGQFEADSAEENWIVIHRGAPLPPRDTADRDIAHTGKRGTHESR